MSSRWIAHLDMDAFYASVELLRYPELRGRPMVVGGRLERRPLANGDGARRFHRLQDYAGRGVITTATYEARALGVHSGMGLMKAAALAPGAILLPADFDEYRRHSRLFKAAVAELAPLIEDRGIDEIYIDLGAVPGALAATPADPHAGLRDLAARIQKRVRAATGLGCSIGVAPNKLLAKLCSDLEKPDGLTLLAAAEVPGRIWPLPASRINGVGPKAAARLESLGILTIGQLARADPQRLQAAFGPRYGAWLHAAAHGQDERPLLTRSEPKSLSRETTFDRDLHPRQDRELLGGIFTGLCEQLAADLARKGYEARTIGIKLRYDDFSTVTRELTLPVHVRDASAIRHSAGLCLKRAPLERRLRLLGVRAGALGRHGAPGGRGGRAEAGANLPLF